MKAPAYTTSNGRCEEAQEFYEKAIGAEVNGLTRWKDCPDAAMKPPPNITMPLMKVLWTSSFGMQIDQFGVPWMVHGAARIGTANALDAARRQASR